MTGDTSSPVSFARSDASDTHLPRPHQLDRTAKQGKVDYFHEVQLDESANQRWLKTLNQLLATVHRRTGQINAWPIGYTLYIHRKGRMNAVRQDYYLLGGPHRFRSPAEFAPHAVWLLTNPSLDRGACNCRYCRSHPPRSIKDRAATKCIPQRQPITSLPSAPSAPSSSTRPLAPVSALQRLRDMVPVSRLPPGATSKASFETPLRPGELLWVYMGSGIASPGSPSINIRWWPAVLRSITGPSQGNVIQRTVIAPSTYTVQMLGLQVQYEVPRRCLLPYQAHTISQHAFQRLGGYWTTYRRAHNLMGEAPSLSSNFLPLPYTTPLSTLTSPSVRHSPEPPNPFDAALEPLLIGIVAAHHMAGFWGLPGRCLRSERPEIFERVETVRDTLWWGPECIRIGDLVRLVHGRSAFPPPFVPHVNGVRGRAFLLAVQTITVSPPSDDQSMAPVPIVGGRVYEIVDLEPSEAANNPSPSMFVYSQFPPPGCNLHRVLPSDRDYTYFGARAIAGRYYADAPRWVEPFQDVDPSSRQALAGLARGSDLDKVPLHFTARDRNEAYEEGLWFATNFWKSRS